MIHEEAENDLTDAAAVDTDLPSCMTAIEGFEVHWDPRRFAGCCKGLGCRKRDGFIVATMNDQDRRVGFIEAVSTISNSEDIKHALCSPQIDDAGDLRGGF